MVQPQEQTGPPAAAWQRGQRREFDLVILGATGFVGRLVVEEIACDYMGKVRWAMAGPDLERLEHVKLQLTRKFNAACKDVPLLDCDVDDPISVDRTVASTTAIINLAGPYALMGTQVVDSCVRMGTHYVDLTGELPWARRIITRYHAAAAARGVRIVLSCGYEAAASDLGAFLIADHCRHKLNREVASISTVVAVHRGMREAFMYDGGFSGGTWESLMNMFSRESLRELGSMQSAYYLCPPGTTGQDWPDIFVPGLVSELRQITAPHVLALPHRRVVHRSNALLRYAKEGFRYSEGLAAPGLVSALVMTWFTLVLSFFLALPLLHPILRLFGNRPRQGPSPNTQLKGCWKHISVGRTLEDAGVAQRRVVAIVGDAGRDPGYWSTSRIVLEAGMALALQQPEINAGGLPAGGVLTPAAAFGHVLVGRLRQAGYSFIVREDHGSVKYEYDEQYRFQGAKSKA